MNVFEAVKGKVTTRQAAELYGIRVNCHGMAVCPFHNDKNPSMKLDMRFHCFACQADGDAVDFVSRLFGLPGKEAAMKKASARMKVITGIQNAVADCQTHKAVHDKYLKIGWKARQAAFAESHKDELDRYNKAFRYLKKQGVDLNVNLQALQVEYDQLQATYTELAGQLAAAKEELQPMKDIRYWVSKVLTPEQSEVEKKPEPKHSITEKMKFLQEQSSNQQEQKTPQQKKQNMEL